MYKSVSCVEEMVNQLSKEQSSVDDHRMIAGDPVQSRYFRRTIGLWEKPKTGERLDQLRLELGEGLGR